MEATYDEVLALGNGDIKKGIETYVGTTERRLRDQLSCARGILADVSRLSTDPLVKGPIVEFLSVPMP